MHKPKVLVILGPTSTGKTDLSIELAQRFNGEVISADSRQVYKELNLLSGKVTEDEMRNIPHHGLDVVHVGEEFSVAEYKKHAEISLQKILDKNKLPIIAGGTGFYIDTLIYNITFPQVPHNPELRERMSHKTNSELFEILRDLDPARADSIDPQNPVRLIRAIEIAKALGSNPPAPNYSNSPYDPLFIGLDLPDEDLKNRITLRIKKRIDAGMLTEVQSILDSGVDPETLYSLGLDVKYTAQLVLGKITQDEMIDRLSTETWQYVKRQRTWWKRNKNILWFNPILDTDKQKIRQTIESFLSK